MKNNTSFKNEVIIDAAGKPLGRLSSLIASKLRAKDLPSFKPNYLPQRNVIVFNIDFIKIHPKKLKQKLYWRYSGYPGGMKLTPMGRVFKRDPRLVLRKTVYGMLPKNRLRSKLIKNLIMFNKEIGK